jgi:hypothetical protein
MRRSASEIIRNLEMRIARLERQADQGPSMELSHFVESDLEDMGILFIEMQSAKACKTGGYCYLITDEESDACVIISEDDRGNQKVISSHRNLRSCEREFNSITTGRELL